MSKEWKLDVQPNDLRLVNASAGSGKTYTLMELVSALVTTEKEDPGCILATTFTKKAAGELRQRIRKTLLESGAEDAARQTAKAANGLIGTVNGVAGRILSDYAIDAGKSPQLEVLPEDAADMIFKRALSGIMEVRSHEIGPVADRLGYTAGKRNKFDKAGDWQAEIHKIVNRARANGIDRVKLAESRQVSVDAAKRWFDGSVALSLAGIRERLETFESELDRSDVGVGTQKYFAKVKGFLRNPTWVSAVAIADGSGILNRDVTPLRDFAAGLREELIHAAGLRDDVVKMINLVFDIAAEGMDAYQQFKERYGLVDFTDQESELLKLLQEDKFQAKLSERVHRVLVDEFQDTSPIQLALFSKLGEIAGGRMTWVGDPKQSIYGFRGADPALMARAAATVPGKNCAQLKFSWRSKERLVAFSNALFENAFKGVAGCDGTVHLEIPEDEDRKAKAAGGEIEVWMLGPKKGDNRTKDRSRQLVDGIVRMHETGQKVRYGDIAVLMRQTADCAKLAKALSDRGVPVAVGGGDLMSTEEIRLAMAAYRYAVDQSDTVALATLAAELMDPDGWLKAISELPKETREKWNADCLLEKGVGNVAAMTPLELLDKVIVHFGIDRQVRTLGEGARRVGNLEELRAKCSQYMTESALKGIPATHAGFVAYMAGDESREAKVPGGDSVKVMTYHAAKGLEWPTVILSTLDGDYKRNPFNLEVVGSDDFDPKDPLKGRKLRWVPCPFGSLASDFQEAVLRGNAAFAAEFDRIRQDEYEERKRLMYVGVTRAMDRLVFAPRMNQDGSKVAAGWLDELTQRSFFADKRHVEPGEQDWTIGSDTFSVTTKVFSDVAELPPVKYRRSRGRISEPVDLPLYKLPPSSKEVAPCEAIVGEEISLGTSLLIDDSKFTAELGDCFHNYMAVAVPGKDNPELAAALIMRWGQQDVLRAEVLVAFAARLRELILQKWPGSVIETEVPMSYTNDAGQVSEGYIDMLVRTADGKYVIIDHKVVKEPEAQVHVKHYAGQQNIYRQAVRAAKEADVAVYLHLPHQGKLVEMKFV